MWFKGDYVYSFTCAFIHGTLTCWIAHYKLGSGNTKINKTEQSPYPQNSQLEGWVFGSATTTQSKKYILHHNPVHRTEENARTTHSNLIQQHLIYGKYAVYSGMFYLLFSMQPCSYSIPFYVDCLLVFYTLDAPTNIISRH